MHKIGKKGRTPLTSLRLCVKYLANERGQNCLAKYWLPEMHVEQWLEFWRKPSPPLAQPRLGGIRHCLADIYCYPRAAIVQRIQDHESILDRCSGRQALNGPPEKRAGDIRSRAQVQRRGAERFQRQANTIVDTVRGMLLEGDQIPGPHAYEVMPRCELAGNHFRIRRIDEAQHRVQLTYM